MTNLEQKAQQVPIGALVQNARPLDIVNIPEVAARFQSLYSVMQGAAEKHAAVKYEAERFHFMKLLQDNPALQACSKISLYGVFMDMAVSGLSFDPAMKHAYVVPRSFKIKTPGQPDKWEQRATLMISGFGELVIRVQQKQLKFADNPVLVFDCDSFEYGSEAGRPFLSHRAKFPRPKDAEIMACYVALERMDGSRDYKVFGVDEVRALKEFSKDKDSLAWNAGFPGMVQTKTIKHAFRSYPKLKLGQFSTLQTQVVDSEPAEPAINYGLHEEAISESEVTSTHVNQIEAPISAPTFNKQPQAEHAAPGKPAEQAKEKVAAPIQKIEPAQIPVEDAENFDLTEEGGGTQLVDDDF
jgi:recombinational DNA repair protein RecT